MKRICGIVLLFLLLGIPTARGQQPETPFSLKVNTQLIIETVSVRDKNGNLIEDLTKDDFVLTEDGVPQTIRIFEFQKLDDTALPAVPASAANPVLAGVPPGQIAVARPGDIQYRDRRLLVLYFDLPGMSDTDQLRALFAARSFIQSQMAVPDLVAIMQYNGAAVKILQDFTDDRNALQNVIDKLISPPEDDAITDTATAFGQDDAQFNIFTTDRQLAALQTATRMLGGLSEQKSLIYFSSGLRLSGVDNQAQMRATENSAIRANVKFYPVDARGLVAMAPLGSAAQASPGGIGMFTGAIATNMITSLQRSQDTLYALASDTGGKAFLDNNDLSMGIVQAQLANSSYYILGYYPTNTNQDGKLRRVKVTLKEVPADLAYRSGYYAGKDFTKFTTADKERQLEDALMLGDPITDLTIALEVNFFQLNSAEYFVPLTVKIPGSELVLAKSGGAERTLIDFIGEVKDEYGTTIQNIRDKVDIKLSGETAAQLARSPIEYDTGFTLLPGKYVVKFLARDAETGRIGTFLANFTVPNLMKELQKIPISSVVLSSQRVDMKDALFNAKNKLDANQLTNPLVHDGQKLIPSVTRVFSKNRDLYVFLQAYERGAATTQPLVAFVTFYRDQTRAFQTAPMSVTEGMDPKSKAVPLKFVLPLDKLQPGEYSCQVTVLDPTGQKVAFWQAPIMLVP